MLGRTILLLLIVWTTLVAMPTSASAAVASPAAPPVSAGVRDSITRLYLAVFDRDPDPAGRNYWVNQYVNGVGLPRIAEAFMASNEWQRRIGDVDDAAFITLLYNNVLERDPDPGGRRYWVDRAANGFTRTDLVLSFSESGEFVRRTGTATPAPPPFRPLPPDSGSGRRIVYDNSAQRVWIVEASGIIRDSYLVSGRRGVPNPGVYQVYSKSPKAWAGHDGITMNHMVRFARGRNLAIGFHSIPRYGSGRPMQTEAQLGTFRSAGCVRQSEHHAAALFGWARIGDTVVVVP
ncbi:MAG: DUF4214 domain-containing protein [Acidimicrobiia bacterium]|nr:DUF4214 domain-containing protein [Acidimicrobiia bacterium]